MRLLGILLTAFAVILGGPFVRAQEVEGVLVLAHGSIPGHFNEDYPRDKSQCQLIREHQTGVAEHSWEKAVCLVVEEVNKIKKASIPVEVAFGMTAVHSFQHAVDRLVNAGMTKLRIIPLYVSSFSDVIREQKEIFGLEPNPKHPSARRVVLPKSVTRIIYENALDDAMELTNVLIKRAQELMINPQIEELILVGHGPLRVEDDVRWIQNFDLHAQRIQNHLSRQLKQFAAIHTITLQDDAPPETREAKTLALRRLVSGAIQRGHMPLILPVLIAPGSIEDGILHRLRGLNFRYIGHMLTPDPEITAWISNKVNQNYMP